VYDNDTHFKIDPVTRQIKNESGKVILMQNDHNSERFTFEIPRLIDGHDMSVCNKVEVHFINLKADKTEKCADVYLVEDLQVSPDSEEVVICSWLISQNATKHAGSLNFVLRFACLTDDVIDYQWYTDIHKGITISESISNTEAVATDYSDILEQWRQEFRIRDGKDGEDGEDGEDGISPTVEINEIEGGHNVSITDKNGKQSFDVMDGKTPIAEEWTFTLKDGSTVTKKVIVSDGESAMNTEEWTFTLEDGSTMTKKVVTV
jgi:hypothetical protein